MTAVKWIVVAIFSLAALGALGMGAAGEAVARPAELDTQPAIALRAFPSGSVGAAPAAAAKPADEKPTEVAEVTPPKADEKPVVAEAPKPPEPKPAEVAKPAEPVAAAKAPPAENKPPPAVAANPPPVVAAPPPPAPKPAAAEGLLNLRASDTADVYLDGKKLGGSPLIGVKARSGNHKVRFDCYDAAGNTVAGPVQVVSVKADAEVDVEFNCPTE